MNLATSDKAWNIIKWRHCDGYYKYLCKITDTMYYLTVYDEDDETLLFAENWLDLKGATYAYNHFTLDLTQSH